MDFLYRNHPPFFQALLAKRMKGNILRADPSPSCAILPDDLRIALIPVILTLLFQTLLLGDRLMLRTILAVCQRRTAGIRARTFWLSGHIYLTLPKAAPMTERLSVKNY